MLRLLGGAGQGVFLAVINRLPDLRRCPGTYIERPMAKQSGLYGIRARCQGCSRQVEN